MDPAPTDRSLTGRGSVRGVVRISTRSGGRMDPWRVQINF